MSTPATPVEPSYASGTGTTPLLGDTIGRHLDRAVAAWPDRDALVDVPSGRRWTYAQFGAAVDDVARGLLAKGVGKGDRVGIWAVNCPEWVLVQYATARIGAIMVNINPAYRVHELAFVLDQAGIEVLVASTAFKSGDYRAMVEQVRGECRSLTEVVYIGDPTWDTLVEAGANVPYEQLAERGSELSCDDPVNIQYTSGTTGFPKGFPADHMQAIWMTRAAASLPVVHDPLDRHVQVPVAESVDVVLALGGLLDLLLGWRGHCATSFSPRDFMQASQAQRMNGGPEFRSTATTIVSFSASLWQ